MNELRKVNNNNWFKSSQEMRWVERDKDGKITKSSNPNGSIKNIAGVCNKDRNVFGMMPHPERAADIELNSTNGRKLFESILSKVIA